MIQKYFQKRQGSDWFRKSVAFGLTMTFNAGIFSNCSNAMMELDLDVLTFPEKKQDENKENCKTSSEEECVECKIVEGENPVFKELEKFINGSEKSTEDPLEKMDDLFLTNLANSLRDILSGEIEKIRKTALKESIKIKEDIVHIKEDVQKKVEGILPKKNEDMDHITKDVQKKVTLAKEKAINDIKDKLNPLYEMKFADKCLMAYKKVLMLGERTLIMKSCNRSLSEADSETAKTFMEKRACFLIAFIRNYLNCVFRKEMENFLSEVFEPLLVVYNDIPAIKGSRFLALRVRDNGFMRWRGSVAPISPYSFEYLVEKFSFGRISEPGYYTIRNLAFSKAKELFDNEEKISELNKWVVENKLFKGMDRKEVEEFNKKINEKINEIIYGEECKEKSDISTLFKEMNYEKEKEEEEEEIISKIINGKEGEEKLNKIIDRKEKRPKKPDMFRKKVNWGSICMNSICEVVQSKEPSPIGELPKIDDKEDSHGVLPSYNDVAKDSIIIDASKNTKVGVEIKGKLYAAEDSVGSEDTLSINEGKLYAAEDSVGSEDALSINKGIDKKQNMVKEGSHGVPLSYKDEAKSRKIKDEINIEEKNKLSKLPNESLIRSLLGDRFEELNSQVREYVKNQGNKGDADVKEEVQKMFMRICGVIAVMLFGTFVLDMAFLSHLRHSGTKK